VAEGSPAAEAGVGAVADGDRYGGEYGLRSKAAKNATAGSRRENGPRSFGAIQSFTTHTRSDSGIAFCSTTPSELAGVEILVEPILRHLPQAPGSIEPHPVRGGPPTAPRAVHLRDDLALPLTGRANMNSVAASGIQRSVWTSMPTMSCAALRG